MNTFYQEHLPALTSALKTAFDEGKESHPCLWSKLATFVPSNSDRSPYRYINKIRGLQEGQGFEGASNLEESGYAIENKDFYTTVHVKRNDIDDNQLGFYAISARESGFETERFIEKHTLSLLPLGLSYASYDGVPFFSSQHPSFEGVRSNLIEGEGDAWFVLDTTRALKPLIYQERKVASLESLEHADEASIAARSTLRFGAHVRANFGYALWQNAMASKQDLNAQSLSEVIEQMMEQKDENNEPMDVRPSVLIVPPSLRAKALDLIALERQKNGEANPHFQSLELVVSAYVKVRA